MAKQLNLSISYQRLYRSNWYKDKLKGQASINQDPKDSHIDNNYKDIPKKTLKIKQRYAICISKVCQRYA